MTMPIQNTSPRGPFARASIAALLCLGAASASAGEFYAVGALGQTNADLDKAAIDREIIAAGATTMRSALDKRDTAFKAALGYRVNPYVAVEGGYVDLGRAKYAATATQGRAESELEARGVQLSALGILPLNDAFSVFGKIGTIHAKVKGSARVSVPVLGSFAGSIDASNWKTAIGAGAEYRFDRRWGVRAEYERFRKLGDADRTGETDVDAVTVGVVMRF